MMCTHHFITVAFNTKTFFLEMSSNIFGIRLIMNQVDRYSVMRGSSKIEFWWNTILNYFFFYYSSYHLVDATCGKNLD